MALDPGADPRDWHLAAIEAVRYGQKAEAIELLEQLACWAEPFDMAHQIYVQLRVFLQRDDADLVEVRNALEDALEWIDGLPKVGQVLVLEQRIADPLLN